MPGHFYLTLQVNFAGFSGNESYRLANGSVLQQTDGVVTQQNPVIANPTAIITINADGSSRVLELVGIPGSIRVMLLR